VSINRYLSDPKHHSQVGTGAGDQYSIVDVIELTIADACHKLKLVLAPALKKLVQTCKVSV